MMDPDLEGELEVPVAKRVCLEDSSSHRGSQTEKKAEGNEDAVGERAPAEAEAPKPEVDRFPKRRKCVILLSYNGKGYLGMQRNPGVPTIEEELLQALLKAQAIPESMVDDLSKLQFQRCARTDKGVSATRQVVSIKPSVSRPWTSKAATQKAWGRGYLHATFLPDCNCSSHHMVPEASMVQRVNGHLPPQIRVMGIKRVTKSFNSKNKCTARTYEYLLPTYVFAPFAFTDLKYRIDEATLSRVQGLLGQYVGTHNFHNFTSGKKFEEDSSKRHIVSFQCGGPFLGKAGGSRDADKRLKSECDKSTDEHKVGGCDMDTGGHQEGGCAEGADGHQESGHGQDVDSNQESGRGQDADTHQEGGHGQDAGGHQEGGRGQDADTHQEGGHGQDADGHQEGGCGQGQGADSHQESGCGQGAEKPESHRGDDREVEFLTLKVRGQSFMLHQIRKMIGLVIAIVRGFCGDDTIPKAYQKEKLDIPRAPALGLLLENVHFDGYNRRFGGDGTHESLDWSEYDAEIITFKRQYILQDIIDTEIHQLPMMQWLGSLKVHNFAQTQARMEKALASGVPSTGHSDSSGNEQTGGAS